MIVAIGSGANPLLTQHTEGMELNRRGYIVADETGRTTRKGVWAGGDIVTGSATVILAMGAGKAAAKDIHNYLSGLLHAIVAYSAVACTSGFSRRLIQDSARAGNALEY